MAKVVVDSQDVVAPRRSNSIFVAVAAGAGAVWWIVADLLRRFAIEPLACSSTQTLEACGNSLGVAGVVAAVLVALFSLFLLATLRTARPLLIVVASTVLLWNLGMYCTGLVWYEGLIWSCIVYALAYSLFVLVAKLHRLWLSLLVAVGLLVVLRLVLAF